MQQVGNRPGRVGGIEAGQALDRCSERPVWAARGIAAGVVALLLIAIRNAWDLVTWITASRSGAEQLAPPPGPDAASGGPHKTC